MSDPIGMIPGLTENQLQATFFAASIVQPQQSPEDRVRCEEEQDDCSDADSIDVYDSSKDETNMAGIREKFLDRLAEVMAPQKTFPGTKLCQNDRMRIMSAPQHWFKKETSIQFC